MVTTAQRTGYSGVTYITKASVPDAPTDVPVSDTTVTSDTKIKVTFASPAPGDGGSSIISYELQMDDGITGTYTSIVGYSSNSLLTAYTVTSGIVKGRTHNFKYRARNAIGWGPFSSEVAILAATVPSAPAKPLYQSFSSSTLYLTIQ